jgi:site-specific DNA-methyltransferase (adenine-specific)
MINLYNKDNMEYIAPKQAQMIYADHIFENKDFSWIGRYWMFLADNGIFAIHTDHKLRADIEIYLRSLPKAEFVNDVITIQRWGGVPKNKFAQKHDYILIYAKGKNWHWDSSGIQIDKVTTAKGFNPSGRTTKTPDACWEDLGNFSTMSGERVKKSDGKNIQWQKPLKQLRRLMTPFLKPGDFVIDPFLGSGTSAVIADELGCDIDGIEIDEKVFNLAKNRLNNLL